MGGTRERNEKGRKKESGELKATAEPKNPRATGKHAASTGIQGTSVKASTSDAKRHNAYLQVGLRSQDCPGMGADVFGHLLHVLSTPQIALVQDQDHL